MKIIGLGPIVPQEKLDLGGGNVKMGYERVVVQQNNTSELSAFCPSGKFVIGGGCSSSTQAPVGTSYAPSDVQWGCGWSSPVPQATAIAICVNIR